MTRKPLHHRSFAKVWPSAALAALLVAQPIAAGDVSTLLKELEKELNTLDTPQPQARPSPGNSSSGKRQATETVTLRALNVPAGKNPAARQLDSRLKSLRTRISNQRRYLEKRFDQETRDHRSHIATIKSQAGTQLPITNLKIYMDGALVFTAEPIASLRSSELTLYQNTVVPRTYQMTIKGSRLVQEGEIMRLENFTVKTPWTIKGEQKRHLALLKPLVTADGKASLEVLFD